MRERILTIAGIVILLAVAVNIGIGIQNFVLGHPSYWDIASITAMPAGFIFGWEASSRRFGAANVRYHLFNATITSMVGMIPSVVLCSVFHVSTFWSFFLCVGMGVIAGIIDPRDLK